MKKSLFIIVHVDWAFISHRLPIALAARYSGYDVTIVTKDTGRGKEIESYGLNFIDIPFERTGTNPIHELKCIYILTKIYKRFKPDIIHHVTIKASLLGCIAAKLSKRRRVVSAISGFGYNFTDERNGFKQKLIKTMMRVSFKSRFFQYIFQNPDDVKQFSQYNFVKEHQIHLIKGSGVDLNIFKFKKKQLTDKVLFVLPARIVFDKGVMEFIDAAKILGKKAAGNAEFILVGECDSINLSGISEEKLRSLIDEPYIKWIGFQKDILKILIESDVVVLPSYREGLPKSLIEACAIGRPIITTDTQGCRECVIDEYNGFIIPMKNSEILAERMEILLNDPLKRELMGENSRLLAEKWFSIELVINKHLCIYKGFEDINK